MTSIIYVGGVVKDQAEADKNLSLQQRIALGVGNVYCKSTIHI